VIETISNLRIEIPIPCSIDEPCTIASGKDTGSHVKYSWLVWDMLNDVEIVLDDNTVPSFEYTFLIKGFYTINLNGSNLFSNATTQLIIEVNYGGFTIFPTIDDFFIQAVPLFVLTGSTFDVKAFVLASNVNLTWYIDAVQVSTLIKNGNFVFICSFLLSNMIS
jgi:hypothetical protein